MTNSERLLLERIKDYRYMVILLYTSPETVIASNGNELSEFRPIVFRSLKAKGLIQVSEIETNGISYGMTAIATVKI